MNLSMGFITVFAVLGLAISMMAGFLVGNRISYIVFVSSVSTLAFSGLGFGVYRVLEKKVPEFLEYLAGLTGLLSDIRNSHEGESHSGDYASSQDSEGSPLGEGLPSESLQDMSEKDRILKSAKSGKFGDHIMVDKIPIKNEPKLMAEAIRTILAKDDDNS